MHFENIGNFINKFKTGGDLSGVVKTFKEMSKAEQTAILSSSALDTAQKQALATSAGLTITESGQVVVTTELAASQDIATGSTSRFSAAMTGLGATIKSTFISLATNPITYITAGLVAGGVALYKYATAFDDAMEKAEESQSAYASTATELESLKSEAEEYKNTLESLADEYEVKLTGTEDVSELIQKLQSTDLSLEDQVQVEQIKAQNAELERQIALKEQLYNQQSEQSVQDAIDALKLNRTQDISQEYTVKDEFGNDTGVQYKETDIITATKNEISELKKLKEERNDLLNDDIDDTKQTDDFNTLDTDIENYTKTISENIESLSTLRESFIDSSTGLMKTGLSQEAQDYYNDITNVIDGFNNIDLSPAEQQLSAIESYFDGSTKSNAIKDQLLEAVKSGQSATDALHSMGVTLNDLGITGEGKKEAFDNYFDGLVKSAQEAEDAINSIDGSVEGVKSAFESDNQDADWTSMADYLSQASELYKNGKVGTDDFKAAVQFISPDIINPDADGFKYDADAYVAAWKSAQDKVKRYFDSENPLQSVANFSDDLVSTDFDSSLNKTGKLATQVGDELTWNFESSAEAAKSLGLSVEATETLMHNLEAYGAEFDDVMWSGEGLERYNTALNGIKDLYDSIEDKDSKERLQKIIDQSEVDDFENNLENLTEEQIVQIEFEYDLASIESEIEEIQNKIKETGGSTDDWAELNIQKKNYQDKLLSQDGMTEATQDEGYQKSLSAVNDLVQNLTTNYDSLGETGRRAIQQQESAIIDLQNSYLEMFQNGEVTNWEEFLGTSEASDILNQLADDTDKSVEEIRAELAEMFDIDEDSINIDLNLNVDSTKIEDTISDLEDGQTITFDATLKDGSIAEIEGYKNEDGEIRYTANIDGVEYDVSSVTKGLDGSITYTANVDGVLTHLTAVENEDGTITYTVNEVPGEQVENTVDDAQQHVNRDYDAAETMLADATQHVNRTYDDVPTTVSDAYQTVHRTVIENSTASGTMHSPAHVFGTAFSLPAHADGQVSLPKNERALVNEMGVESLIRDGKWTLIPGGMHFENLKKGDIVLSASQTESLMKYGKAAGTGKAYANGTLGVSLSNAYANGFRIPSAVTSSSSSSSTSKKSSTSSKSSSSNSSTNSATEAAEEFSEELDYIEIKIDRIERQIESLELVAESAFKTFGTRNTALKNQISAVTSEISIQQQAYNRYLQQANSVGLSSGYAAKVRDGLIDIETITDETLKENIESYQEWYEKALDAKQAVEELKETVKELYQQEFDNLVDEYDNIINLLDHRKNILDGYIDQTETQGYIVSTKYYSELIANEEETLNQLTEERAKLVASLNNAMTNGGIEKYSEAWYEMLQDINDVDEAIQESNTNIIEFGNSIRDIQWDVFDKIQDLISSITDESDFLIDLMSSKDLFDDKGVITDQGKATIGLYGVNYNTYMSQADEYRKEMEKIQEQLAEDPYNQDLIDRRKELLELQQESILAAEDEKEAIKELVEDGIDKQLDALQDLIEKYEDMLDEQADMYDYQQTIAEKQKEINTLEKQLAAYKGDSSEEGAANRQKLQNELNELKVDMEETQYEQAISEQKKLLDNLYSEYETVLNMRLDNIDVLIMDIIGNVNSESAAIRDTIISEAESVGYEITDSMNTIWENNCNNIVDTISIYGDNFTSLLTSVQTAINDIKLLMQKALGISDTKATTNVNTTNSSTTSTTSTTSSSTTKTSSTSSGDGVPKVGDAVTFASGNYYYSSDGLTPTGNQMLGQGVYITKINTASWATKPYHISTGGKLGNGDLGWVTLSQLKGYKTGSKYVNKKQWARVNEDGDELVLSDGVVTMADGSVLRKVNAGDKIFNNAMSENLWNLAQNADSILTPINQFANSGIVDMKLPEFTPSPNASTVQNDVNVTIEIEKVQDYNDFVHQLQQDNKFEKMIQEVTLGQALGHGKLRKYQIKL